MWPDQYIEWAIQAHPLLTRVVANVLAQRYLAINPRLYVDSPEIVRDVIQHTFNLAAARRVYATYFTSIREFRWWLSSIAFTHLRDRLMDRVEYAEKINSLEPQLMQSFGWVVLDGITSSDVARRFGISVDEVERRVSSAVRFILE